MADAPRDRYPILPGLTILERLGGGAVGTVYLARHESSARLVAVKVLRREYAGNRLYLERLRREARLSARLDHPNVVKGIDLGEVDGIPFFVMEFVDGKSLKTVLRERGRLEEEEVLEYGFQLARALDHAYRHGVVHRDIKPGNLLITRDGTLKLADLGLARRPDDSSVTKDGVTLGTPHYISPEQARDPVSADVRSDLYSVGATLFHAATGRPPFDAETVAGVLSQVLDENLTPKIPDDAPISKNLELVLRRLLTKDPNRRYQIPDDLIRDLERVRRRERPDVSVFDINPIVKKRVRAGLAAVAGMIMLAALLYGVAKWAGAVPNSKMSEAARELAGKLNIIEKESASAPGALADRWSRLNSLLGTGAFADVDRVRAVELLNQLETQLSAVVTGLERACEQDLTKALGEHRFGDASQLLEQSIPSRFHEPFEGSTDALPPKIKDRIQAFLQKKSSDVEREAASAEVKLTEALPRFLAQREGEVVAFLAQGRYKSALLLTTDPLANFEIEDGLSWSRMPHAVRERLAVTATERMNELRSRILENARDTTNRISERLRREHDRLEEALRGGLRAAVAADFEEIARRALEDAHYVKDEWAAQVSPDPQRIITDLSSSLHTLERQRERDVADRAFLDYESQLAVLLHDRQYTTVRDAWRARISRSTVQSVTEKMERRARYADLLVQFRERVRRNLELKSGKRLAIRLRSDAVSSGKVNSVLPAEDDFIIKLTEGNAAEVRYSVVASADILSFAELSAEPADRFLRAVFWMAENELDRAQPEFTNLSTLDDAGGKLQLASDAQMALIDVDAMRAANPSAPGGRERRYEDYKKAGKNYESNGEFSLAKEWYEKARREAQGFDASDPRIQEIDNIIKELEARQRAPKADNNNNISIPGAAIHVLPDGKLEARFDVKKLFDGRAAGAFTDWTKGEKGISYDPKTQQLELHKAPPGKLNIPMPLRGPIRAVFKIHIPFGDTEPAVAPRAAFSAFGRTVVFAGSRSRGSSFILLRAGGVDGAEGEIQQLMALPEANGTLGLVRGCVHEIVLFVDADQKATSVYLDQQLVAKNEIAGALYDSIEIRSNAAIEWREFSIDGIVLAKR